MTRATWAFALGIVGVGAWGLASLAAVALVPFPPGPQDLPLLVVLPSAIRGGISIASLVAWYVVYHGVLERFRRRELVARPLGIYLPAPPYYPGYYPAPPMSPSAASPPPPSPPAEGHPEKPPGT